MSIGNRATGNSRSGIPGNLALPNSRREFPGILRKLRSVIFFPVISSLFVQFHYHLQQTLSVNYNVLSINHWSIISIGTKLQFRKPLGTIFSQPSIYIDGWLYAMSMTSVVCNVPVLSQNDWTYHHSVFTT